ncbi:MAG: hypothetical protein ABID04_00375 [Patescibacteria group bacterium]
MKKIKKVLFAPLTFRIFLFLLVALPLAFFGGYHPDILNHVDWGIKLWQYGFKDFYEQIFWGVSWPNQPLGSMLLFGLIAKLYQLVHFLLFWLNLKIPLFPSFIFPLIDAKLHLFLLKLPFILAHVGISFLVYRLIKDLGSVKKALGGALLFLLNPAAIYNAVVWGQTDSLINLLALLGFILCYKKRYFLGLLLFLSSFYFKLSLLIWLPVLLFLFWQRRSDWIQVLKSGSLAIVFLLLLAIPFVHHGNLLSWVWYLYTNRVLPRQGNMLSGNAFNLWQLLYGMNLSLGDSLLVLGIKAKSLGMALALSFSGLPALIKRPKTLVDYLYWLVLVSLSAFLFLTNMHERYLYPLLAPMAVLVAVGRIKARWFWLLTIIHLLNLYTLWWYPMIKPLKDVLEWGNFLPTRLLSLLLILIFAVLLKQNFSSSKD